MTLGQALHILAEAHTADDELMGFVVYSSRRRFLHADEDYVAALRAIRVAAGMPVETLFEREARNA